MAVGPVPPGAPPPPLNTGGFPLWHWLEQNQTPVPIQQIIKDRDYLFAVPGRKLRRVTAQSNGANGVGTVWIISEGIPNTSHEYVNRILDTNDTVVKLYEIPPGATTGFVGGKAHRKRSGKGKGKGTKKQKLSKRKRTQHRKRA